MKKNVIINDGAVRLYCDNSTKFETTGIGVSIVTGNTATIAGPSELVLTQEQSEIILVKLLYSATSKSMALRQ